MNNVVLNFAFGISLTLLLAGIAVLLSLFLPERAQEKTLETVHERTHLQEQRKLSLTRRARLALKQGIFEFAEDLLYQASGIDDRDAAVLEQLAVSLQKQGKFHKARIIAEKLVGLVPTEANLNQLGVIYQAIGDEDEDIAYYERSIACYQAVLKKNPDNLDSLIGIGKAFEHSGDNVGAIASFLKVIEQHPHQYEIVVRVADLFRALRDLKGLETHLLKAVDYFPEDAEIFKRLTELYFRQKRFTDIVAMEPKLTPGKLAEDSVVKCLSLSYFYLKSYVDAKRLIEMLVERDPGRASHYYNYALILHAMGDKKLALAQLQKSIDRDDTTAAFYYLRAKICLELGNKADAIPALQRVVELDGDHFEARQQLRRLA